MTEEEAQAWLDSRGWWTGEEGDRLRHYAALLLEEADRQNLISAASRSVLWARHIVDSAQLLPLASARSSAGLWVDLGTGAGLPGIVIACLRPWPIMMIETRPLRTNFLQRCVEMLGLPNTCIVTDKVERVELEGPASVISARAYAPLDRLIGSAAHLANSSTTWLLPKGRNAEKELEIARRDWQAAFHVEQSLTDRESAIVTITDLQGRTERAKASQKRAKKRNRNAMRTAS